MYATPVPDVQDLVARVVMAGEAIRHDPGVFARVGACWLDRCRKCVQVDGRHVEHLM